MFNEIHKYLIIDKIHKDIITDFFAQHYNTAVRYNTYHTSEPTVLVRPQLTRPVRRRIFGFPYRIISSITDISL